MLIEIDARFGWLFIVLKALSGIISCFFAVKLIGKTYENEGKFSFSKYWDNNGFCLAIFFALNSLSFFSTMINSIVLYYGDLFGKGIFAILMGAFLSLSVAVLSRFAFRSFLKNKLSVERSKLFQIILFTVSIIISIGGIIYQIVAGSDTNPFSVLLILLVFLIYIMLLFGTYSSYKLINNLDEVHETLPKIRSLILALSLQLISLILIIIDFILKETYNTVVGVCGWFVLIVAVYYFNKTI